jgi:hypothetical protein
MVAKGLYIANNRKDFPIAADLLRKALAARGLSADRPLPQ